jgi:hypothetical protein
MMKCRLLLLLSWKENPSTTFHLCCRQDVVRIDSAPRDFLNTNWMQGILVKGLYPPFINSLSFDDIVSHDTDPLMKYFSSLTNGESIL